MRDRGYHLLFRGVTDIAEVGVAVRSWNLDGAVVLGFLDEEVDLLSPSGTPMLALDSYSSNPETTGVRSDDREGGRLAAQHLLTLGHRQIAFASPAFSDVGLVRQRFDGFLQAHADAGVRWNPADLIKADPTWELGVGVGRTLATDHPGVTAVFVTADILAVGIMEGIRASGRSVPRDDPGNLGTTFDARNRTDGREPNAGSLSASDGSRTVCTSGDWMTASIDERGQNLREDASQGCTHSALSAESGGMTGGPTWAG